MIGRVCPWRHSAWKLLKTSPSQQVKLRGPANILNDPRAFNSHSGFKPNLGTSAPKSLGQCEARSKSPVAGRCFSRVRPPSLLFLLTAGSCETSDGEVDKGERLVEEMEGKGREGPWVGWGGKGEVVQKQCTNPD